MKASLKSNSQRSLHNSSKPSQRFLINWVNSLGFCQPLTITEIPDRFRLGVFPLLLLRATGLQISSVEICDTPRSKAACLQNIHAFLACLAQHRLCTAPECAINLYQGKSMAAWDTLELTAKAYANNLRSSCPDLQSWLNKHSGSPTATPTSLSKALNSLLTYLQDPAPSENLIETFSSLKIPLLFCPSDFFSSQNSDFLLIQLHMIYTHSKTRADDKESRTISPFEYSFSTDTTNVEEMEKQVAKEERKLMFLSEVKPNEKKVIGSCRSQLVLSQKEIMVCYLITPRIVQVALAGRKIRAMISVLPDEERFTLINERYILECKEISGLNSVFAYGLWEIEGLKTATQEIMFTANNQPVRIRFKSTEQCRRYFESLQILI